MTFWKYLIALKIVLFLTSMTIYAQDSLTFSVVEGVSALKVVEEAYYRMGITIKAEVLPAERSLTMSNAGETDGEINRRGNLQEAYPNLIMITVPILSLEQVVFTKKVEFPVQGWESLKPYEIGVLLGMKIVEEKVQGMRVTSVGTFEQLLLMLDKEKLDIAVFPRLDGLLKLRHLGLQQIKILEPPLLKNSLYHYIHKKHQSLVPKLTTTLRQMEKEGFIHQQQKRLEAELQK